MLGGLTVLSKGLRTIFQEDCNSFCAQAVLANAPVDIQRDGLYILSKNVPGAALDSANAMFDWIKAMQAYRDSLNTTIAGMTFDQLTVYSIPNQAWPAVPVNMPTMASSREAPASRAVRK